MERTYSVCSFHIEIAFFGWCDESLSGFVFVYRFTSVTSFIYAFESGGFDIKQDWP